MSVGGNWLSIQVRLEGSLKARSIELTYGDFFLCMCSFDVVSNRLAH